MGEGIQYGGGLSTGYLGGLMGASLGMQLGSQYAGQIPSYDLGTFPNPGELYSTVMGELQGYGNAAQADLKQNYLNAMGMGMQSLASSGLAGTSVAPSMRMGYFQQYSRALNDLNQKLTQTKVGYQTQIGMQAAQMAQQQQQFKANLGLGYARLFSGLSGGGGGGGGGGDPEASNRIAADLQKAQMQGEYGLAEGQQRGEYGFAEGQQRGEYGLAAAQIAANARGGGGGGGGYGGGGDYGYSGGYTDPYASSWESGGGGGDYGYSGGSYWDYAPVEGE